MSENDSFDVYDNTETDLETKQVNVENNTVSVVQKRKDRIRFITGTAILTAVEIVFCFIGNYLNFGQVNINLALIPICLAACMYGPLSGLFIGLVNGVITILSPSTMAFMQFQPIATVFVCLFKTGMAGLVGGFIFKIKTKPSLLYLKVTLVALAVPFTNTLLFVLGSYVFFLDIFKSMYDGNVYVFILAMIWLNFVIEIAINIVLTPSIYKIVSKLKTKKSY